MCALLSDESIFECERFEWVIWVSDAGVMWWVHFWMMLGVVNTGVGSIIGTWSKLQFQHFLEDMVGYKLEECGLHACACLLKDTMKNFSHPSLKGFDTQLVVLFPHLHSIVLMPWRWPWNRFCDYPLATCQLFLVSLVLAPWHVISSVALDSASTALGEGILKPSLFSTDLNTKPERSTMQTSHVASHS